MPPVTVRVPATTANLGPGFDCLGLALDLWNQAAFSLHGAGIRLEIQGEGAGQLPENAENLLFQALTRVYQACGQPLPPGLHIRCRNRIPLGSGLGSSAAAILAGLLGANALLGSPLSSAELLRIGTDMEGHADNLGAALLGGLVIVASQPDKQGEAGRKSFILKKISIPPPAVAVAIPRLELSTRAARAALPAQVPLADAVYNLGRTALVIEALRQGDLELLGQVMDDHLHQPYRLPLIPGAAQALQAARQAGASAAALSGAGPAIAAFSHGGAEAIAAAMAAAFQQAGVPARGLALRVSDAGSRLRDAERSG
jgi:homoserine kinase